MCNHFEYLARKRPDKVPNYGKRFRGRLKRIKKLSPHNVYKYRKKIKIIILDRAGKEINRHKEYKLEEVFD